jgi:aldehyde:ferredoxin oxidoreductase
MGLCKLPWNDSEPEDNRTKYKGIEAAKVPEHVENYCLIYEGVTGDPLTPEKLIEQSRRTYNFQRMFNLRQGFGTRAFDAIPYRAMGPVTVEEYESRQKRYDDQLKEWLKIDPSAMSTQEKVEKMRAYREEQYHKLQDVVYARRGWDNNGVPTQETLKVLGIDFPEVLALLK